MWHSCSDSKTHARAIAHAISTGLQRAIDRDGRAGLAVSGGRSPIPVFVELSAADICWKNVHISLVDERFVAPDDENSNEHLVRTHLLKRHAARAHFKGLITDPGNIDRCVEQANRQAGKINIAVLGMGDDGHTASLFPNAPQLAQALDASQQKGYISVTPVTAPYERISMTLTALLETEQLILSIAGKQKKEVFELASQAATPALPISYLISQNKVPFNVYWHP